MEPNDTLIESAPGDLVGALRELDLQVSMMQNRAQALLQSHVAVKGWSLDTHDVNFDLAAGMFTVTPKQIAEAA